MEKTCSGIFWVLFALFFAPAIQAKGVEELFWARHVRTATEADRAPRGEKWTSAPAEIFFSGMGPISGTLFYYRSSLKTRVELLTDDGRILTLPVAGLAGELHYILTYQNLLLFPDSSHKIHLQKVSFNIKVEDHHDSRKGKVARLDSEVVAGYGTHHDKKGEVTYRLNPENAFKHARQSNLLPGRINWFRGKCLEFLGRFYF